ncbi:unnamed protein product [Rotaria sp. Silwood1]|nr:unnamed protein product [Rotaria sp. Silwood1]CAF1542221.1 unnamed protein product [Rotaria sp. Silwood1]CAF3615567.1 unnamed protein product [Rotaria sp. Silwood1]CAF4686058.1 unnamed protein product [Rotaria sp. Silwood1]
MLLFLLFNAQKICFPFCTVNNESSPVENLGQILFNFLRNSNSRHVCTKKFTSTDANQQIMLERLMKGMILNYQQQWILDNIPIMLCYRNTENREFCSRSFPIGCYVTKSGQTKESCNIRDGQNDIFYVFNHLDFEITYHNELDKIWESALSEDSSRIISAKIQVNSLNSNRCDRANKPVMFQSTSKDVEIPFYIHCTIYKK